MTKKNFLIFSRMLLLCTSLISVSCSSVCKINFYRYEKLDASKDPELSYYEVVSAREPNTSVSGPLKIIYRKKFRLFRVSHYQYAAIRFQNVGTKYYTWGPWFLPIIPNFDDYLGGNRSIHADAQLEFTLSFSSDPAVEAVIAALPDLEIIDQNGRLLTPKVTVNSPESKTFVYATTIKNTPWFILKEAQIKLSSGRTLKIPRLKFILVDEVEVQWALAISP